MCVYICEYMCIHMCTHMYKNINTYTPIYLSHSPSLHMASGDCHPQGIAQCTYIYRCICIPMCVPRTHHHALTTHALTTTLTGRLAIVIRNGPQACVVAGV